MLQQPIVEMDVHGLLAEQARQTGQHIIAEGITADEIICSPLSRAADTAKLISEMTGIPYRVEPRLIEQNFGKWESVPIVMLRLGKGFVMI